MGSRVVGLNFSRAKIMAGGGLTRFSKWPAVAVVAFASSFYTLDYTKSWWKNFTDRFGLTLRASDSFDLSETGPTSPWWKRLLGNYNKDPEPCIPLETIQEVLGRYEFSKDVNHGVVSKFETNQIAANNPIEDRNVECLFSNTDTLFFGIFDGHSGYHCSQTLKTRLPQYVSMAISKINNNLLKPADLQESIAVLGNNDIIMPPINLSEEFENKQKLSGTGIEWFSKFLSSTHCTSETHEELMKLAFLTLDRDICTDAIPDGVGDDSLLIGLAGSCAIASCINGDDLYVANTGDCRAVMGRRNSSGKWTSYQITQDQTVENSHEVKRIEREHPNEKRTSIQRGRLLGQLQPLRAFGDVQYKWSQELHERVLNVVYGRPVVPPNSYLTPPYLTSDPVVSHRKITKEDGFLIVASDGLWEKMSSDHAVKLIGRYLDTSSHQGNGNQENGATRLIRYALGGGSDANLANMLSLPNNFKRHFHDDITVTVVYFDSNKVSSKL